MANCLRYVGVPGSAYRHPIQDSARPLPQANQDCMPARAGTLIQTLRGSRRLLHDELANGLGVSKQWLEDYPPGAWTQRTVALHMLQYLMPPLLQEVEPRSVPVPKTT
jgi:hypothetical protein